MLFVLAVMSCGLYWQSCHAVCTGSHVMLSVCVTECVPICVCAFCGYVGRGLCHYGVAPSVTTPTLFVTDVVRGSAAVE